MEFRPLVRGTVSQGHPRNLGGGDAGWRGPSREPGAMERWWRQALHWYKSELQRCRQWAKVAQA